MNESIFNKIPDEIIDYCEQKFIIKYPLGFADERWQELSKRHNDDKITQFFTQQMTIENLDNILISGDTKSFMKEFVKAICKSSMISVFEKTALRNYSQYEAFDYPLISALRALLANYNEINFNQLASVLSAAKTQDSRANPCKWPVVSIICYYSFPNCYPVKPTTIKNVAQGLKVDIAYKAQVNFQTYENINQLYANFRKQSSICKNMHKVYAHALLYSIFN